MTNETRTLIEQWNDNMFISSDAADEDWRSTEEQCAEEEAEQEHFGEDAESDSEYQDAYEYLRQQWGQSNSK